MGFMDTPESYMADSWNVLDLVVVVSSVVSLALSSNSFGEILATAGGSGEGGGNGSLSFLKIIRALRVLRPLRTIRRNPNLRRIVTVLLACLPVFAHIVLVSSFYFLVFAILGTQLFGGLFWSCNDASVKSVDECVGNFTNDDDGSVEGRRWRNQPMHFDNVLSSLLTLFEVSSLENWLEPMYAAMDLPDKLGDQPVRNRAWPNCLFFVVFVVFGSFLLLNMFVGAVCDRFAVLRSEREAEDGQDILITEGQNEFVTSLLQIIRNKPTSKLLPPKKLCRKNPARVAANFQAQLNREPGFCKSEWYCNRCGRKVPLPLGFCRRRAVDSFRRGCFHVVSWDSENERTGNSFDLVVAGVIVANAMLLACFVFVPPHEGQWVQPHSTRAVRTQQTTWNTVVEGLNVACVALFTLEIALKLLGLGFKQ